MEFQTCNSYGSIQFFTTFTQAYQAWQQDSTIFKISFDSNDGTPLRWIPKVKSIEDLFSTQSEQNINELCPEYMIEQNPETVYLIRQAMITPNHIEIYILYVLGKITEQEYNSRNLVGKIIECITTEQFVERYS